MISEVDLRDWDKVDFKKLEEAKNLQNEYEYPGACSLYEQFVKQVLELYQKQINTIPALLRKQ